MPQLMRRCAPLRHFGSQNPSGKKRRKAARELNPLPPDNDTDYSNGHPYSSVIYEALRMVRKLTKPKS